MRGKNRSVKSGRISCVTLLVVFGSAWGAFAYGNVVRYPSGLVQSWEANRPDPAGLRPAPAAIGQFLSTEFPDPAAEWREIRSLSDATHEHHLFALYYRGRRVVDHFLNLHYNRAGWLQYATSLWRYPLSVAISDETANREALLRRQIESAAARGGRFDGKLDIEPVIWVSAAGRARAAFEVKLLTLHPTHDRDYFVDETDFTPLQERVVARFSDPANHVYLSNPYPTGVAPNAVTIPGLGGATTLTTSFIHVLREQLLPDGSGTVEEQEVDPTYDFSQDPGFTQAPDPNTLSTYNYTCYDTSDEGCPIEGFDAVNIFYHVNAFRTKLQGYYATLGVSPTFMYDPLPILVNALSVQLDDSSGRPITSNNAAYVPEACGGQGQFPHCLIFLKPETVTNACGTNVPFYSLARDANIATHEYQHYVTDQVTHIIRGITSLPSVGDALHEGYSDYFGVSHVSEEAQAAVTRVGEYAFQDCPGLIRDLAVARVFPNSPADTDPHVSGLTWASGLWKLRGEFQPSPQTMDLLVLKSQFYLSQEPGFVEAIEALVKADEALNGGSHVARIRELFYDELKFTGAEQGVFQDEGNDVVAVGFQSCNAVHSSGGPGSAGWFFAGWLVLSLGLGRRWRGREGRS